MDKKTVQEHGLSDAEYQVILEVIGREPNFVELGIFSVMWSEHCCYKSSKIYLKNFPTTGPRVLQGPGENAGIIDIGGGVAAVFKIESHNHPSFIEPYQGAATGVGGILRDIFTMGARPIANMNSIHFGEITHPKTRHLLEGVVAGIGGYGNCMGIPMVGGETHFHPSYSGNNLVNAFTLGIVRKDKIFKGIAKGVGNPVILVGSKTGRDGIHGATMASDVFSAGSEEKRPTVQVGDPFTEKKLLEACMEAFQMEGAILGIQDMGAAGFTCSSFEMSDKGKVGMELWLDKIPQREEKMTPYEIMLSESQERMLLICEKGREEELRSIFEKWELEFAIVGRVIQENICRGYYHGELAFELPVAPITEKAPLYQRPTSLPKYLAHEQSRKPEPVDDAQMTLRKLIGSPNIASKRWIYRQHDQMVGTNTVIGPGADAAVVRVKENGRLLAMTCDAKATWVYLDPYWGAAHTVAEAARNLACVGALPIGVTDNLNFGNPENPEIMWQFKETCAGLAEACRQYEAPIIGGNVSLYNETNGTNIFPTPTVAMVGILPEGTKPLTSHWKNENDLVFLVGEPADKLDASQIFPHGKIDPVDFKTEIAKNNFIIAANSQGLLQSAHDVSLGGLAVAIAKSGFLPSGGVLGVQVELNGNGEVLFGENRSPFVVSISPKQEEAFCSLAKTYQVTFAKIGVVKGKKLVIRGKIDIEQALLQKEWKEGLCAE